jgi:hypothetical protein
VASPVKLSSCMALQLAALTDWQTESSPGPNLFLVPWRALYAGAANLGGRCWGVKLSLQHFACPSDLAAARFERGRLQAGQLS